MNENLGLAHFFHQTDAVGYGVIALLLLMSVASWTLILLKGWRLFQAGRRGRTFVDGFRRLPDGEPMRRAMAAPAPGNGFERLAHAAWAACRQAAAPRPGRAVALASADEFVAAALTHAVAGETARLEQGLGALASVASAAPFVGLFGTVWGIYHALLAIGATGQAGLDQVAGAVGESLIMTGAGLAVAVPAVLGHNALAGLARQMAGELESFGQEVFTLLATGHRTEPAVVEPGQGGEVLAMDRAEAADGV